MVYTIFDQKTSGGSIKNDNMSNQHIAEELYKSVIRKFKKKKNSPFIENIWGADLADMQLISKFSTECRLLLCVIGI